MMDKPQLKKPEVVVEDILTAAADAIMIVPGISLGGTDVSDMVIKKAGVAEMPTCEIGSAVILPAGDLQAKWLIVGKAIALGDGKNKELLPFIGAMQTCLALARQVGAQTLAFASLPTDRYDAQLFSVLSSAWRPIIESQRTYGMPALIRIICQNAEIARYYRVVYNYWYAVDKSDRLEDEHWD